MLIQAVLGLSVPAVPMHELKNRWLTVDGSMRLDKPWLGFELCVAVFFFLG